MTVQAWGTGASICRLCVCVCTHVCACVHVRVYTPLKRVSSGLPIAEQTVRLGLMTWEGEQAWLGPKGGPRVNGTVCDLGLGRAPVSCPAVCPSVGALVLFPEGPAGGPLPRAAHPGHRLPRPKPRIKHSCLPQGWGAEGAAK